MRLEGEASWLAEARLLIDEAGTLTARITHADVEPCAMNCCFTRRTSSLASIILKPVSPCAFLTTLAQAQLSRHSLTPLLASERNAANPHLECSGRRA